MRVVVAYDISCDRRRTKVAEALSATLSRVQYSVFEGDVPPEQLDHTLNRATRIINGKEDSIRVYPLCASCSPKIEAYGRSIAVDTDDIRIL